MVLPRLYVPLLCVSFANLWWDHLKQFLFFFHKCFRCNIALIFRNVCFGFRPISLSVFCITLYTLLISVPSFDFFGSTMMAFESCSYATIMYLYPLVYVTGNCHVWSVNILDDTSITKTILSASVYEVYLALK